MKLKLENSHFIDFNKMEKEVFILLNISYGFMRLREDQEGDVLGWMGANIFKDFGGLYGREVSSLLVSISISGRMLDDVIKRTGIGFSAADWDYHEMLGDDSNGNYLSLRECFNKVIHAEKIDHEIIHLPEVCLSGAAQKGQEWSVRLFILPFCISVYEWVQRNKL